ncbi:potassium channel family protein [Ohessyouella blattaphilus]|uniref:TrkA family potassium uptake protein n=1 Tax=Ohessyouella blattaphilus TaxID=2949333 RepID=A0ABT1EL61_9FIRM|nr:TrkA family potassium uptake protein [Ohessyouella blattaphilus]MCP1111418.1 TrkA family potassium uptake protein [Ohessyouella blattaphilus]MCR8564812.1 TrkA family potassium uptake protein [Ohessyouella blattaphilus]MDL2249813.1 TrkA family potassium uptake protein [Lachnospiraceae bacterium OttesenSCG-928-J05]
MKNKQYAVLGLGNFGESVALTLQELGCEVIAVDHNEERIQRIADHVSYAMKAEVGDPEVMKAIGARNLDGVVVAFAENMEASIMATLLAKEIGVPFVLAKANNETHEKILKKIGADAVIYPERETGERVAKQMLSANFTDWITLSREYSIIETTTPEGWVGRTLEDLNLRENFEVTVVGMIRSEEFEINPDPKAPLEERAILILLGADDALKEIRKGEDE